MTVTNTTSVLFAAFGLLALVIIIVGVLVYTNDIDGDDFMLVVVGPVVGGFIGFVAGTKGVQQGSAASNGNNNQHP